MNHSLPGSSVLNTKTSVIRKLWYIYTMEYYSAIKKNTFESVLMRWMKLEPIIQSKVSQKEKHQYSISEEELKSLLMKVKSLSRV